ncbi:hypothetical protein IR114_03265 [Granulicatella sp. 19428wC4_WM01]|nr:hypothetical protein [Granulicatella sp. WM01]MBF0780104.1 hypothetical protein [Granulicatella sp. 19428wC4_WM01]
MIKVKIFQLFIFDIVYLKSEQVQLLDIWKRDLNVIVDEYIKDNCQY